MVVRYCVFISLFLSNLIKIIAIFYKNKYLILQKA